MSGDNHNPIDAAAADWLVRHDAGGLTDAEQTAFARWLEADPRHRGAYLRAQAMWATLGRAATDAEEPDAARPAALSRRTMLAAAGVAAVTVATGALLRPSHRLILPKPASAGHLDEISTAIGEMRRVPLRDGSLVSLNTDSALKVSLQPKLRGIALERGEAWFQVAKDSSRPFVVSAGNVQVRAVGTAFSVYRQDFGARVFVTEGLIETWSSEDEDRVIQVGAGEQIFVSDVSGPSRVKADSTGVERSLAWRSGEVSLDGETLGDAAAEFNRYNLRKITIDPELADRQLVGVFHANEPESFARAAALLTGATVTADDREIHLAPGPG